MGNRSFLIFKNKLNTTEMKMLRIDSGVTFLDKIPSQRIRASLGIKETISEKIEERQLKWYGLVTSTAAQMTIIIL